MGFSKNAGWGPRLPPAVRSGSIQTAMSELKTVIADGNPIDRLDEVKNALATLNTTIAASNPADAIKTLADKIDQHSVKAEFGELLSDVKHSNGILEGKLGEIAKALGLRPDTKPGTKGRD